MNKILPVSDLSASGIMYNRLADRVNSWPEDRAPIDSLLKDIQREIFTTSALRVEYSRLIHELWGRVELRSDKKAVHLTTCMQLQARLGRYEVAVNIFRRAIHYQYTNPAMIEAFVICLPFDCVLSILEEELPLYHIAYHATVTRQLSHFMLTRQKTR